MILYNVTININDAAHDEWLEWMKNEHIPDVMSTGMFTEYKMFRLLGDYDSGGITYAVQYFCKSMTDMETYNEQFGPALKEAAVKKFGNEFVAFRSLLEMV